MRDEILSPVVLSLDDSHPAKRFLTALMNCRDECVGLEDDLEDPIDEAWTSSVDGREWSFSQFAYVYLAPKIALDEYEQSVCSRVPCWLPAPSHMRLLMTECEQAAGAGGNWEVLRLIPQVLDLIERWEEYLSYRRALADPRRRSGFSPTFSAPANSDAFPCQGCSDQISFAAHFAEPPKQTADDSTRDDIRNPVVLSLDDSHPAKRFLEAFMDCRDDCVGLDIGPEPTFDQKWTSNTDGREWSFSAFAYSYLSMNLEMDEYAQSACILAPGWLPDPPRLRSLMTECAQAARESGNPEILAATDQVLEMLDRWEEYLRYRRESARRKA